MSIARQPFDDHPGFLPTRRSALAAIVGVASSGLATALPSPAIRPASPRAADFRRTLEEYRIEAEAYRVELAESREAESPSLPPSDEVRAAWERLRDAILEAAGPMVDADDVEDLSLAGEPLPARAVAIDGMLVTLSWSHETTGLANPWRVIEVVDLADVVTL